MKRFSATVICAFLCILAGAQTFKGLDFGASYQEESIFEAMGTPDSSEASGATVTYRYGECSYTFDNGRFVDASISGSGCSVETVNGILSVGDNVSKLLALRIDLEFVEYPEGMCRLSYPAEDGRTVQFFVKYDADRAVTSMNGFTIVAPKERTSMAGIHFYESIPSVETPYFHIASGDKLEDVLAFKLDIEFSSYGNGICRVYNKRQHEQYLVRYDLDRSIREILPVLKDESRSSRFFVR